MQKCNFSAAVLIRSKAVNYQTKVKVITLSISRDLQCSIFVKVESRRAYTQTNYTNDPKSHRDYFFDKSINDARTSGTTENTDIHGGYGDSHDSTHVAGRHLKRIRFCKKQLCLKARRGQKSFNIGGRHQSKKTKIKYYFSLIEARSSHAVLKLTQ